MISCIIIILQQNWCPWCDLINIQFAYQHSEINSFGLFSKLSVCPTIYSAVSVWHDQFSLKFSQNTPP